MVTASQYPDSRVITFTPSPTVDAGANGSVCANNSAITLNGSFTGSTGAIWSGGTGTYNPNNTTMNAVYTPSAAERTAGTVTLTLTTTGNGNCNAVSDAVTFIDHANTNSQCWCRSHGLREQRSC
jgi:hypothetical protein